MDSGQFGCNSMRRNQVQIGQELPINHTITCEMKSNFHVEICIIYPFKVYVTGEISVVLLVLILVISFTMAV